MYHIPAEPNVNAPVAVLPNANPDALSGFFSVVTAGVELSAALAKEKVVGAAVVEAGVDAGVEAGVPKLKVPAFPDPNLKPPAVPNEMLGLDVSDAGFTSTLAPGFMVSQAGHLITSALFVQ